MRMLNDYHFVEKKNLLKEKKMKTNKTSIKSILVGTVLVCGLFMSLPSGEVAHASEQSSAKNAFLKAQAKKKAGKTEQEKSPVVTVPKASEIKTFEDIKKAAVALYNSPLYAPEEIVFTSDVDYDTDFSDYFYSDDFSQLVDGYTYYGRTIQLRVEEQMNGKFKNTLFIYNDRDKADETDWTNRMNLAEKYIVDNYTLNTEYDVVLAINDFVGQQISYGTQITSDNPYVVQRGNATTCTGYTDVAAELYKRFGIESRLVGGLNKRGIVHAWNAVKVGGNWYYADATGYDAGDEKNPNYLMMTNSQGSTPRYTDFKVSDVPFEMSMAKLYSYEKQHKPQVAKK